MDHKIRKLFWVGSTKKDLAAMPSEVQDAFGYALHQAPTGKKHEHAKPLKGFGSAGVLEVVKVSGNGTFRSVYTVKFGEAVYVRHCTETRNGPDSGKNENG